MLTNANTSSSSVIEPSLTSKLSFSNSSTVFATASSPPTTTNRNSNLSTGRYSPSNFYRAAAVAAVANDSNNRRYMPSTSVSKKEIRFGFIFRLHVCVCVFIREIQM